MRITKKTILAIGLIASSLTLNSCDDNDNNEVLQRPTALVTVYPSAPDGFFMQLDESTSLVPTNMKASPFGDKNVRALVLHFVPHRVVPDVIVGVVVPFDHRRDLRLVGIGFQHVVFALGRDADEHRRLEVGRRRRLERRVGVADDCAVFPHAQHLSEADVLLLENGSRIDGVICRAIPEGNGIGT